MLLNRMLMLITFSVSTIFSMAPSREIKYTPSQFGIIMKPVGFITKDNMKIKGWFYPAQNKPAEDFSIYGEKPISYSLLDSTPRPTIIVCNGDAGNIGSLVSLVTPLFCNGFNVLTFDWRGYGESQEYEIKNEYLCDSKFLLDYDAAIDFIKKMPEVDSTRIGVYGYSTGAYLSFAIAAKRKDIKAFAGRSLMTSFSEVLQQLEKNYPQKTYFVPANYPMELQPIKAATKMQVPTFLIVGEKDIRTPPWMSQKVFNKLKGPKEIWIVPKAEHSGKNGVEAIEEQEFYKRLIEFYNKYLKSK